ncbi:pentatricopeptide repeat-containing protein At3g20730-like [Aristolochia californica]|uniref:pentatricopeptide repeat-containing protein At3g20730-like n=1 Tax=Aristolochia californica TaxID=171875 RepID=UPI0035E1035B
MRALSKAACSGFGDTAKTHAKIFDLCRLGRVDEALQVLTSISFNAHLCSFFLQFCVDSNAETQGRYLHDHLARNGFPSDVHLNTKFIVFYSRMGDVNSARRVFDEMPHRSIVSWTALISGYTQNGYPRRALEIFPRMRQLGFKCNDFTYGSILRACTVLLYVQSGEVIHGCALKDGFCGSLFVQSALIDLYSKCGRSEKARILFETMLVRDVVCWNVVIGGYAAQGLDDEAFGMFREMLSHGMLPDHFTFMGILKACGGVEDLAKVHQIHGIVTKLGLCSHSSVSGSLIGAYGKCRSLSNARLLYDIMPEKDLISSTTMITSYAQSGKQSKEALEFFGKINHCAVVMDEIIMCSMLNVCADLVFLSLGQQIHALALKKQPFSDTAMGNALIDMYAKSGNIEDASRVFYEMENQNVISWTSLITGYGKHGYGEEAISLFNKMLNNGLKPNDVTFLSLLFACSHAGMIAKGWEYFHLMMNEYKISPRAEHYSCIVDLLGRGGLLEEAYNLVCDINMRPNASVWRALLGACRIYGNKSLGEIAARHLFDLEAFDTVNYVILSNIYASAGLWDDALNLRKIMRERGMMKEPGHSFISSAKYQMPLLLDKV